MEPDVVGAQGRHQSAGPRIGQQNWCSFYHSCYRWKNNIGNYLNGQFFKLWAGRNNKVSLFCLGSRGALLFSLT